MKSTINPERIATLPKTVVEQLHYLSTQKAVDRLFLSTVFTTSLRCVVVLLNDDTTAMVWRKQKWIRKAFHDHGITFLIIGPEAIIAHQQAGTLFLDYFMRVENQLYVSETSPFVIGTFQKSKKRFKKLEQLFRKEIDLLEKQISKAEGIEAFVTVFSVYITFYEHYFFYLEWILFGITYADEDLHSRLNRLAYYISEFRKAFVMINSKKYFLIEALYSVTKAEQEDLTYLDLEMLPSIKLTKDLMNDYINGLFKKLKKFVKEGSSVALPLPTKLGYEDDGLLQLFTKIPEVETIYEYERSDEVLPNGCKLSVRYWLIVGDSISNYQLINWYDAVKNYSKGSIEIVPIAHSRIWIQKHLFENQLFFQKVMDSKFLIYERTPLLPEIHWQFPYTARYPDMDFYSSGCLKLYASFQLLRTMDYAVNREGYGLLYSSLVVRCCQLVIYRQFSYYPNHLPVSILWRLCELADKRVYGLRFLLSKLVYDLIEFVTYQQNVYRAPIKIKVEDLEVMDQIVGELVEAAAGQNVI